MKLIYLGRSQANAAQAFGLRLDGTDKIENFEDFLEENFSSSDRHLIYMKSAILLQLPLLKDLGLSCPTMSTMTEVVISSNGSDLEDKFNKLFPEFVGASPGKLSEYLGTHKAVFTSDGNLILADTCCEDTDPFFEKIFKALCDHLGVQAALCTPVWSTLQKAD